MKNVLGRGAFWGTVFGLVVGLLPMAVLACSIDDDHYLDQSTGDTEASGALAMTASHIWVQEVTAGMAGQLHAVDLYFSMILQSDPGNPYVDENITVSIFSQETESNGLIEREFLGTDTQTHEWDSDDHTPLRFSFLDDDIFLEVGETFEIWVTPTDTNDTNGVDVFYSSASEAYEDGGLFYVQVYSNYQTVPASLGRSDMLFATYMQPVPEPSSFLMMGSGLTGLAFLGVRRKKI